MTGICLYFDGPPAPKGSLLGPRFIKATSDDGSLLQADRWQRDKDWWCLTVAIEDTQRLEWMQFHGARVAWGNDDEFCSVVWSDRDGERYTTALHSDWRAAIDEARRQKP